MSFELRKLQTDWEIKCWGRVNHIFCNKSIGVSYLEVKRGFRCSTHYHEHRNNSFFVHSGVLIIESWWSDPDRRNLMVLCEGECIEIPAKVWHRFRVYDSGLVTEIYTPIPGADVRFDDIVRFDIGGEDSLHELKFTLNELGLWD